MPSAKARKPTGRPSEFSDAIADQIVDRLIDGETLIDIGRDEAMPHRSTVYRWMDADAAFATRIARAREGQAEFMDHTVKTIADACTPETAAADRVKIAAYQWRAAKMAPKSYGERVVTEHQGKDGGPIQSELTVKFVKARDGG